MQTKYVSIIKEEVERVRKRYGLEENAPITDYIFTILKNECVLMEWPEKEQLDLDGFSTEKVINGRIETVVYINTAKNKEKQNFCAAHELGHRYGIDKTIKERYPHEVITPGTVEDIMNRFAAELMMPEVGFRTKAQPLIDACKSKTSNGQTVYHVKSLIKAIVELMDFYYVPYKSVVVRLEEVEIIPQGVRMRLEAFEEAPEGKRVVEAIIFESGITRLRITDEKIQYSIPFEKYADVFHDPRITKYMNVSDLRIFLMGMGLSEMDIALIENIKKIETETITI